MCGLFGIGWTKSLVKHSKIDTELLTEEIRSRGPDNFSQYVDDQLILAHRRLSILDLDPRASQPMLSSDGRYVMVFNGEIYNFKEIRESIQDVAWRTTGDSEVVIEGFRLFGINFFSQLDGMFSIFIYDRENKIGYAARDRSGEKPFYYLRSSNKFVFSSSIETFYAHFKDEIAISEDQLEEYELLGFNKNDRTLFKEVFELPPGKYMEINFSGDKICQKVNSYWTPSIVKKTKKDIDHLSDELDVLIHKSIKARLVADVDVGVFLSGGLDSSLVATIAAKYKKDLKAFSIGFENKAFDESSDAERVARSCGLIHHKRILSSLDVKQYLLKFEELKKVPFFDQSIVGLLPLSEMASKHVKVVLTGDGADELFGGYHYHFFGNVLINLPFIWLPDFLLRNGKSKVLTLLKIKDPYDRYLYIKSLDKCLYYKTINNKNSKLSREKKNILEYDFLNVLPKLYLNKVDIGSMAYSLEARAPYLSNEIIDWGQRLPIKFKFNIFKNKIILKKVAERYLPKDIIYKNKKGFGVPLFDVDERLSSYHAWNKLKLSVFCDSFIKPSGKIENRY